MIVKEICPLSPQQRALKLGLDLVYFPHIEMSQTALEASNFVKKKDRSNWKVCSHIFSCINGAANNITKLTQRINFSIALTKYREGTWKL